MDISLPKIKLGRSTESTTPFDFDHDNNTTAEFGFMQPLFVHECMPRSVMKLKMGQFVRLGAMNSPTYGRVSANTYHRFVPISEIMPTFEYMLAGKPYHVVDRNYIPSSMPSTSCRALTLWLLTQTNSLYSIYKLDGSYYKVVTGSADISTIVSRFNEKFYFVATSDTPLQTSYNYHNFFNTLSVVQREQVKQFLPTPAGADFIVKFSYVSGSNTFRYCICFKFSQFARRLRKILIGCGYQLNLRNTTRKSILPLVAFYKAWFDLFCPKQTQTWTSTPAFKMLDRVREYNQISMDGFYTQGSYMDLFLKSLLECYYTQKPDFVSANIATPALSSTGIDGIKVSSSVDLSLVNGANTQLNQQPYIGNISTSNLLTRNRLLLLNKLTKFVNKNTVIGGKIADYLHVHYGADFGDDLNSYDIGQQSVDCKITQEMVTASTDIATTGEYTGKGIGSSEGRQFTYRAKEFGYWISMFAIVPNSGYCQSIDASTVNHLTRFDFPIGEFDALGNEITTKEQVCGAEDVFLGDSSTDGAESASFGFIPRLTHCKVKHNVANGCISLRSTRLTYLPYTLDRWITTNEIDVSPHEESDGSTSYLITDRVSNIPIASEAWRYPTRFDYLGNFNRIFQNSGYDAQILNDVFPIDDNFIVHNLVECKYIAPLLPISESYDTDGDANNALSVTKA